MRCGNVDRAGNKGFEDTLYRLCKTEEESLTHIWKCEQVRRRVDTSPREWVEEFRDTFNLEMKTTEMLEDKIIKSAYRFERIIKEIN